MRVPPAVFWWESSSFAGTRKSIFYLHYNESVANKTLVFSVIVVSIGRLVTLASAGTHLLDDLTWTTVTYLEWVQCEGPISLISVCLPSIIYLTKSIKEKVANNTHGTRGTSKTFRSSTASQQDQLVTMDDYSPLQQSSSQKQVKNYSPLHQSSPLQQSSSPRQVEEGLHRQELAA